MNLHPTLALSVQEGRASLRELSDGTYDLAEVLDINEAIIAKAENRRRASVAARERARANARRPG